MPTKRTSRTVVKKAAPVETVTKNPTRNLFTRKNLVIAGLIVLALLFWFLKSWFIVATVNGQPISRFELNQRLNSQFGTSVLDQLINERLLLGAVRQQGIFVTSEEINGKVTDIEKSLEGKMSLNDALNMQGMSPNTFKRQLELQLSIEKMFAKDATVSASEIEEFLKNSKDMFPEASDPAKLQTEAEGFLKQQKIQKLYEEWFNKIKEDAKVSRNI